MASTRRRFLRQSETRDGSIFVAWRWARAKFEEVLARGEGRRVRSSGFIRISPQSQTKVIIKIENGVVVRSFFNFEQLGMQLRLFRLGLKADLFNSESLGRVFHIVDTAHLGDNVNAGEFATAELERIRRENGNKTLNMIQLAPQCFWTAQYAIYESSSST